MSGPLARVTPSNSEWAGGNKTPGGPPTNVGGSFSGVGASGGPPPSFGTPATAFARNDRGSNIRIPYARVVSLHAKDSLPITDLDAASEGHPSYHSYEYDGLVSGELAWIMTKQFGIKPKGGNYNLPIIGTPIDITGFGSHIPNGRGTALDQQGYRDGLNSGKYGNLDADGGIMVPSAGGFGVNRMERMAHTLWVESHMRNRVGRQIINLVGSPVVDYNGPGDDNYTAIYNTSIDSNLEYFASIGVLTGGSMFAMPDLAYAMQSRTNNGVPQVAVPMMQGIYVMEKGPFLRSYGAEHDPVEIEIPGTATDTQSAMTTEVDRHLGSSLAQGALLCELKKAGLLNWTPDGICLSKDHSGQDGETDAYFDAKLGQLFNIAIQGPTVTKTWAGLPPDMVVMPCDRVFVLIVADLSYELGGSQSASAAAALTSAISEGLNWDNAAKAYADAAIADAAGSGTGTTDLAEKTTALLNAWAAQESNTNQGATEALKKAVDAAKGEVRKLVEGNTREDVGGDGFKKAAEDLRAGRTGVKKAELMNFRLKRATSSWLASASHFDPNEKEKGNGHYKSRCGLKIGFDGKGAGNAEYILGGWCIGTVCDSAASRAYKHNSIRAAPNTFAISVNVNVEWWDADKLYSHYQDVERDAENAPSQGTVFSRANDPFRHIETVMAETGKGYQQAKNILDGGVGDFEGAYKQPNPKGADRDATSEQIYDRSGEATEDDPRVWAGATGAAGAPGRRAAAPVQFARGSATFDASAGGAGGGSSAMRVEGAGAIGAGGARGASDLGAPAPGRKR